MKIKYLKILLIKDKKVGFDELSKYAETLTEVKNNSGRQEMLESKLNQYIFEVK